jgi:hypothetical protein
MNFPHGVTVKLRSTVTTDDGLGNTEQVVTESSWGPCAVAPRYATESTDPHAPRVIVGKTVYGPARTIDADDTLVIAGVEYQVDGLPGEWVSPFTGWAPGIEVPVVRAG